MVRGGCSVDFVGPGWLGLGGLMEKTDSAQQLAERRGKTEIAEIIGKSGGMGAAKKEISQLDQLATEVGIKKSSCSGRVGQKFALGSKTGRSLAGGFAPVGLCRCCAVRGLGEKYP